MRRIAIMNQKGGVGKTTSAVNLGHALARRGKRVLLVDLDPQSHLSLHVGYDPGQTEATMYHLLTAGKTLGECRQQAMEGVDFVPSHIDLAAAEMELVSMVGREVILRDALRECEGQYDFVFTDCPPSLGVLTLNGLCAATEVFVPLQGHFLALQGMGKLFETVRLVSDRINPALLVTGILLCMYEAGTRLAGEVVADLRSFLEEGRSQDVPWKDAVIFETAIRRNIKLAECPSHGMSIFDYEPNCNGARDYEALALEILGKDRESGSKDVTEKEGAGAEPSPQEPTLTDTETAGSSAGAAEKTVSTV